MRPVVAPDVFPLSPGSDGAKTMSSLEIAEITGRKHNNVRRSLLLALAHAGLVPSQFDGSYRDSLNRRKPCYYLPRDVCDRVLDARFTRQDRDAIDARWRWKADNDPAVPAYTDDIDVPDDVTWKLYGDLVFARLVRRGTTEDEARKRVAKRSWLAQRLLRQILEEEVTLPACLAGQPLPDPAIVPHDPQSDATVPADNDLIIPLRIISPAPPTPAAQPGLAIFNSSEFGDIRTVTEDGKPLFCAKDVATALGYARPADAVTDHCKGVVVLPTPSPGGIQAMKFIPESDVYRLVMRSKLPGAERFQDWVVEEVLPTIRKTGRFEVVHDIPQTRSGALRLAADLAEQNEEQAQQLQLQTRELAEKDEQIEEAAPKVDFYDELVDSDGLYGINAAAKLLRISLDGKTPLGEKGLFELLRDDEVLTKSAANWNDPSQGPLSLGYFRTVPGTREGRIIDHGTGERRIVATRTTKVTPKGLTWLKKKYAHLRLLR